MTRKLWSILTIVILTAGIVCLTGCENENGNDKGGKVVADGTVKVRLATTEGDIVLHLDSKKSPVTVANFVQYVNDGFYDGLIFHRVIPNFMVQTGGFDNDLNKKAPRPPIVNETTNKVRNLRGTIAMARSNALDSATSQFFINHKDNPSLDFDGPYGGYAVFGAVVEGMHVVDEIAKAMQQPKVAKNGQPLKNCPAENVIIISAKVVTDE